MARQNLYALFAERFPRDLGHPFLECETGSSYSYRALERETARLAFCLVRLGLVPGDRVLAQVEKSPQALFLYLAVLRAGGVYVPLNPAYSKAEVEYFIQNAEPGLVVGAPENVAALEPAARAAGVRHLLSLDSAGGGSLVDAARDGSDSFATVPRDSRDLAAILYTSGTTGRSKGALLSHQNLASNALALHACWGWQSKDVLLHALPIFHVHGLFVATHCALLGGSTLLFLTKFDVARVVASLPRATVFMGVPTYYTRLLAARDFGAEDCRSVRLFISGSAPLLPETFRVFAERTGHRILERYGMTETGMIASNPLNGPRVPGAVGLPLPGVSVRVMDGEGREVPDDEVGDIQVKGDNVFSGYFRAPENARGDFTPDGYFRTGDVGKLDAQGYLSLVGRSKDLVISGGLNVYPKEIEQQIDSIEGVLEAAVIGIPHPDFGEAVVATVVRRQGSRVTEEEIIRALKEVMAAFKVPKRVVFLPELPRNAMGKVQKSELRAQFQALAGQWSTRSGG